MNHFNFVELVTTNHASFFGTIGASFFTVAWGVGEIFLWKIILRENFVTVKVHKSGLSGWKDEFLWFGSFKPEDIFFEFWELTGCVAALFIKDVWRENHLISVSKVAGDEVVDKSPLQTSAQIGVNPGSGTGNLGASLVVD